MEWGPTAKIVKGILIVLAVAAVALFVSFGVLLSQEARYLRCEIPADIEFYAEIREELPPEWVEDWVAWNEGCEWTGPSIPYVTMYGDTVPGASIEDWVVTDDAHVLRIWLMFESPRYALREEFRP